MIIVKNRELLIPNNERYIGTTYDNDTENRVFQVPRFSQRGVDLAALTFRLDIQYANESYDTVILDKEVGEAFIILIWKITSATLQVPGTLYIGIRAVDSEATVKWSSFSAAMYAERHLNTPGNYTGDLTEIEQMEQDHQYMKGVVDELKANIDYAHDAEAWAKGTRSGSAVPSTDPTYHKNSKYYSDQASTKATAAANSATAAANSATQAAETVADTNTRFNNAVEAVTSETEVIDARVGADGTQYTVLKNRLDTEHNQLKSHLSEIRTAYGVNLFDPDALIPNTFLDGTTGAAETNNNYWATDFIPIDGTYTVRAFEYSGSARTRVYMYDSNKTYDHRAIQPPETFPGGYTFTWSGYIRINLDNGNNGPYENPYRYMLVRGSSSYGVADVFVPYFTALDKTARENLTKALRDLIVNHTSDYDFTDLDTINDNSIYYTSPSRVTDNYPPNLGAAYIWTVKLNTTNKMQIAFSAYGTSAYMRASVNDSWGAWKEFTIGGSSALYVTKAEAYETSTIALFPSVGCCGDSFTAGYLYNKPESQWYDPDYVPNGEYPAIGYPAVMGRLYGVDVTAYAKGGLTSTAYRTDAKGLPALLADDPKYLYIIALGLNDKTQNVPLGVEADIDTEPSTPTYLGNMGAIIRAIKNHAPYARIILCKSLWMNTTYYNYISDGVNLLSSHLGIPYIETLGDPYFESSAYKDGLKGLHPTAPLYAGMGKRIGELVGKCVIDNPEYFYNFYVPNA